MNKKRFVYFKRKIRLISTLTSYREKRYTPKTNYSSFKYFGGEIESSIYLDITKKKKKKKEVIYHLSPLSTSPSASFVVVVAAHLAEAGPGRAVGLSFGSTVFGFLR